MRVLAHNVVKVFPGVRALDGVNLDLRPGTVHALLGENGAGKSTLIKVLTGVYQIDGGQILIGDGDQEPTNPVTFANPSVAQRAGIGVVHQERNLIPAFSVAENIALQALPNRAGFVDRGAMRALARRSLAQLEVELDLDRSVGELSVAHAQLVEIAKALAITSTFAAIRGGYSQVLLLDEPTASLTGDEADRLYTVVRRLRDQGRVIVLVSHKLEEVFAIADTVTVLRDGRSVAESRPMAELSRSEVVDLMVGRAYADLVLDRRVVDRSGVPALSLESVDTSVGHRDVTLAVHPGEIVGLYGLVGAGRSELVRALLGLDQITGGTVRVAGNPVTITSVGDALRRYHIGYVTENRKEEGVFGEQTVARNVSVTVWNKLATWGLVRDRQEDQLLGIYRDRLGIRLSGPRQLAGQLSGGNQQKISLAKWLAADCSILIIDEPTVGIDVRTKAAFHRLITELAERGIAILLISSDLPEMVTLADRIHVMSERRLVGEVDNTHHYASISQQVIRLVHGEPEQPADQPGVTKAGMQ